MKACWANLIWRRQEGFQKPPSAKVSKINTRMNNYKIAHKKITAVLIICGSALADYSHWMSCSSMNILQIRISKIASWAILGPNIYIYTYQHMRQQIWKVSVGMSIQERFVSRCPPSFLLTDDWAGLGMLRLLKLEVVFSPVLVSSILIIWFTQQLHRTDWVITDNR